MRLRFRMDIEAVCIYRLDPSQNDITVHKLIQEGQIIDFTLMVGMDPTNQVKQTFYDVYAKGEGFFTVPTRIIGVPVNAIEFV